METKHDTESRRLEKRLNERFVKAMATYHLIDDDDSILVALSGGKDSLLLTELLARRARILHPRFRVEAVHVRMENIRYESDTTYLEHFCASLGIPLHVVTTRFDVAEDTAHCVQQADGAAQSFKQVSSADLRRQKQPCFLCSWNRRKQLFNLAQQIGCNKIALGHHQDDLIRTALMNLIFQGRFEAMAAKLKLRKMPITIIRPLCLIQEADIKAFAQYRGYQKQMKLCPYEKASHRSDIAIVYDTMVQLNPEVRSSIWRAINNDTKLIED